MHNSRNDISLINITHLILAFLCFLSLFLNFCIFGQGFYDGCSEGVLGFSGALFSPLRRGAIAPSFSLQNLHPLHTLRL